jgi:hypothetical protein
LTSRPFPSSRSPRKTMKTRSLPNPTVPRGITRWSCATNEVTCDMSSRELVLLVASYHNNQSCLKYHIESRLSVDRERPTAVNPSAVQFQERRASLRHTVLYGSFAMLCPLAPLLIWYPFQSRPPSPSLRAGR